MRDADAAGVAAIVERDRAGNRECVFVEPAMNRDVAPYAFGRRRYAIDNRQQRIGWTGRDQRRLAHICSRLNKKIQRVVIDGQWRDFRAVIPRQVFPLPTGAILWTSEVSLIADEITLDSF